MKKHVPVTIVFVALGAMVSLYFGCTNPQNSNSNTNSVVMASPQPTPDKAAIEAEISRIENDWPRIVKERDAAAVRKIEADDIVLVYPDGTPGGKEQDVKDIESGALSAESQEVSDLSIKVLDEDSAIATLRTTVKGGKYKTTDGKTQDISGQFRSVDTFARRNGQWQLVGSATVKILAPTMSASPTPKASPSTKPSPAAKVSPAKASPAKGSPPRVSDSPPKTEKPK